MISLAMIEKLPDAEMYKTFAYQIKMLRQFKRGEGKKGRRNDGALRRSTSSVEGKNSNSVHGYKVYDRSKSMSRKMTRATSTGNLNSSVGKANRYL